MKKIENRNDLREKKHTFLKDLSLVVLANGTGLVLSLVMNLLLPKLFSDNIASYGYVQLYLLYVGYYYIFTLGICNGIYLKEGGRSFDALSASKYSGQFWLFFIIETVFGIIIALGSAFFVSDQDKRFVFILIGINVIIMGIREFFLMIFQATSRIKDYSLMTMISKCVNASVIIVALLVSFRDYKSIIVMLTIGEAASLIFAMILGRKLFCATPVINKETIAETKTNALAGLSILVSGATAMLVTGFAKLCVENHWGIETFAKISFTISIANLFVVFANAISVVLYPRLRKSDPSKLANTYSKLNITVVCVLFLTISLCYPARVVLELFLPEYKEALIYVSILLPMCVFIGKTSIVTQTYMKALRLEKQLMISNVISFVISAGLVVVSVYLFESVVLTVFSILIGQMLRATVCEAMLARTIHKNIVKTVAIEVLLTAFFVITHWIAGGWLGSALYFAVIVFSLIFALIIGRKKGYISNTN